MIRDAEEKKKSLLKFNEVQAPVFKIKNDPRFIKFGKVLSSTGLDESIQVLNVLKGEMSLVGPRPLPISEAKKLPIKYKKRFSSLPGITSEWVIEGAHHMSLKQWMNLDLEYVKKGNIFFDCYILFATLEIISKKLINYGKEINKKPSPPKD